MYKTGHKEVLLPLLIPRDMLEKEAKHIAGFLDQVFWVTKGGDSKLEIELSLRPTSETSMTYYFKNFLFALTFTQSYYIVTAAFWAILFLCARWPIFFPAKCNKMEGTVKTLKTKLIVYRSHSNHQIIIHNESI